MNESKLRSKFHEAIGEEALPAEFESQTRVALKRQIEAPRAGMGWLPGLVAIALGIAIIASLLAIGEYRRNHSQPTRAHSSGPAVVYFQGPSGWKAMDWTGRVQGPVGSERFGIPYQSPDGSRLLVSPQGVWQIVDANGKVLSTPDLRSRGVAWADDSSGICALNVITENPPNGGSYDLVFYSATGGARTIASVTTKRGPNVAACSPSAGRVVITTASGYKDPATELRNVTFGELIVIDFKTGSVLHRQSFPLGVRAMEVQSVIVSHDGSLGAISTQTQTTIVELLNDQVVARLSDMAWPLAFSWDDRLLVVDGPKNRGEILSISSGQVVWSDSVDRVTQGAVADPHSSDVMLFVTTGGLTDLVVVSSTGRSKIIATGVFPDQVGPCFSCSAA